MNRQHIDNNRRRQLDAVKLLNEIERMQIALRDILVELGNREQECNCCGMESFCLVPVNRIRLIAERGLGNNE